MSNHEARQTTNHDEIRRWAEEREGRPATVADTAGQDEGAGVLRIAFRDDSGLEDIGWDQFFEKFDDEKLAFLYQDRTEDGGLSRFFKLVERD